MTFFVLMLMNMCTNQKNQNLKSLVSRRINWLRNPVANVYIYSFSFFLKNVNIQTILYTIIQTSIQTDSSVLIIIFRGIHSQLLRSPPFSTIIIKITCQEYRSERSSCYSCKEYYPADHEMLYLFYDFNISFNGSSDEDKP